MRRHSNIIRLTGKHNVVEFKLEFLHRWAYQMHNGGYVRIERRALFGCCQYWYLVFR